MTFEEMKNLPEKEQKELFKKLKSIRHKAKTTNFSATYKVGVPSLARNAGITEKEAKKLLEIYWKRNKAILQVENALEVKQIMGQKWIKNPVSGFWYTLRAEKDRFSTLNQGTAVYVFDTWLKYLRNLGVKIAYQCHDEWLGNVKSEEETDKLIEKAIQKVNEELKLNIQVKCSSSYGQNYAECH
jgi:DNA polymerase I-like protein with 3'-5' exonuclease and polymerase domains